MDVPRAALAGDGPELVEHEIGGGQGAPGDGASAAVGVEVVGEDGEVAPGGFGWQRVVRPRPPVPTTFIALVRPVAFSG